tara:strand:- start:275 stop:442 length:168 start_codon:yes stop_codon:yes gene_type:complete
MDGSEWSFPQRVFFSQKDGCPIKAFFAQPAIDSRTIPSGTVELAINERDRIGRTI